MRKWIVIALAVLVLLLAGCSEEFELRTHQVRFVINGQVQEQTVIQEEYPKIPDVSGIYPVFVGWQDAQGQLVDVNAMAVTQPTTYTAVFQPELTQQCPYLFLDTNGMLRPDELITYAEVKAALEVLCEDGKQIHYPQMPDDSDTVMARGLQTVLSWFYGKENLPSIPGTDITRAQFAVVMDQVLGWSEDDMVKIPSNAEIPKDLTVDTPDLEALLRASVPYTEDPNGQSWQNIDLPTTYAPGFVSRDGYLYFVEEDGTFLRNGDVGQLHFDETGRLTLGDTELDGQIAEYLKVLIEANPEATRLEILRLAFAHCYQDFTYVEKETYPKGETGWELAEAKEMLYDGQGNSYNFAAVFCAYARMLGYEAEGISGTYGKKNEAHGWVKIEIDGKDYFFDPYLQFTYAEEGDTEKDMFQIATNKVGKWNYKWKK